MEEVMDVMTDRQREAQIVEAFVDLTSALVEDELEVGAFTGRLLRHCLTLLGTEAGGILLHHDGELRVLATSDDTAALLETLQLQSGQGPCLEAFTTGDEVVLERLADHGERWPRFVPHALAAGYRSTHAVPLRARDHRIGALNMFATRERLPDANELALARGLADVATVGLLNRRVLHRAETTVDQLEHALQSRIVIEQAKGRIAERTGLDMVASFELLRSYARARNLRLHDTARSIIENRMMVEDLHV
jgi:GAF domain-containing protein